MLAARAPGGELLGLFVNFACHLTVMGGSGFTADYVYHLRETLRRHYKNPRLPVGFLLGAAGDVTQVDNLRPGREFGEEWSSMFGLALGAEVIQTVARLTWRKDAVIQAVQTFVPIPIREPRDMAARDARPRAGLGLGRRQDLCPRTRDGGAGTSQTAGHSVRSASHPDRRPGHRHQRGRVFLPARPGYQGGQPVRSDLGGQPGQPVDRLRRDPVGVLRRRLRAANRPQCQDGPVGRAIAGRRHRWRRSSKYQQGPGVIGPAFADSFQAGSHPLFGGEDGPGAGRPGDGFPVGLAPGATVFSWTHCWIIWGDWLHVAARRIMPLPSGCCEDHGVVGERVVVLLLAELADVFVELLVELGQVVAEELAELGEILLGRARLQAAGSGSWP